LWNLILLTRPHNGLIAAGSVLTGAFVAGGAVIGRSVTASVMALFACAGAYVLNDVYDVATDRISKPWRPLAAGRTARDTAVKAVVILWALASGFALLSGGPSGIFLVGWIALLWLYSRKLKTRGWVGHVLVSLVASSGFVLGALLGGDAWAGVVPFVIAFLFHMSREVAKSVADLRGDLSAGLSTLAVRVGERKAITLLVWLTGAVIVASLAPYAAGLYGTFYILPVALVIYPMLGVCIWFAMGARRPGADTAQAALSISRILKAAMPVGLVAFVLARV
jgi:geranylgeranylglycerol-phosphate geranylgeranyltransferase